MSSRRSTSKRSRRGSTSLLRPVRTERARPWAAVPAGLLQLRRQVRTAIGDAAITGRMFHKRDDPAGHEPRGAHRHTGASYLGDFHQATSGSDIDSPPRSSGGDLVGLCAVADVDDDFYPVAFHAALPAHRTPFRYPVRRGPKPVLGDEPSASG